MTPSGRPRNSSIDEALLRAAADLVAEKGYARLTVEDIVSRAGTTKPAFYRRYRDVADIVPQALIARHGDDQDIDTGSLVGDLLEVQRRQMQLFTDPVVVRGIAGWLSAVDADPVRGVPFIANFLTPRRAHNLIALARATARGEIPECPDPDYVADLMTGPFLMRAVLPGMQPIDEALVVRTVNASLEALGYTGDRVPLPE